MNTLRLFIAFPFSEGIRKGCSVLQDRGRRRLRYVKWCRPGQMHLTLLFLGRVDTSFQIQIEEIIRRIAEAFPPFTLEVSGIGIFPQTGSPRVIWAGISHEAVLITLQKALVDAVSQIGFQVESRPYRPHLTLGRVKGRVAADPLLDWVREEEGVILGSCRMESLILMESRSMLRGVRYIPRLTVRLREAA